MTDKDKLKKWQSDFDKWRKAHEIAYAENTRKAIKHIEALKKSPLDLDTLRPLVVELLNYLTPKP